MSFETERIPEPPPEPDGEPWGKILIIVLLELLAAVVLYEPVMVPMFDLSMRAYRHWNDRPRLESSEDLPVVVEAEKKPDPPPEAKPLYDWERERLKDLEKREIERTRKDLDDLKKKIEALTPANGSITREAVEHGFFEAWKSIITCWNEIRGRPNFDGLAGGEIRVRFRINPNGLVEEVQIIKDEVGLTELTVCVRDAVNDTTYSPPVGGSVWINYPLIFASSRTVNREELLRRASTTHPLIGE